jgi:hypothetical protein
VDSSVSPSALLIGFCTGLTILSGLITMVGAFMVRRYIVVSNEVDKLKETAVYKEIKQVEDTLKLRFDALATDFRTLSLKVEGGLTEMRKTHEASVQKYEQATVRMLKIHQEAEGRFKIFQEKLQEIHVIVERWKSLAGAKKQ